MPATAARPRRVPPSTWKLRAHRVAVPVARAVLGLPRRRRAPVRAVPKVTILLVHAWGMGGTIRTMLTVAGWLARRHEVEVLSVWRTREKPFFPFPPGVTVTAADDRRRGAGGRTAKLLRRLPGALLFPGDHTHRRMTLWSDIQLVRHLRASRPDVLIGTRPALNLLVAGAGGAPARVASEHTAFSVYREPLQREIWRRYDGAGRRGRARRARARAARGHRAGVGDPQRGAAVRGRAGAAGGAGGGGGGAARGGQGLRPPDPGVHLGGRGAPRVAAADLRRRASAGALAALIDELRLGERVELAGKVRDIEAELEAASVFALSSRVEGLPLALLEAMAKGLAVVSFDNCAGPCEVIEHGADGLLVPGGDERALARAICALIESPDLRRRLGDGARRQGRGLRDRDRWPALGRADRERAQG